MYLYIDGDILTYRGGFASDSGARSSGEVAEPLEYALHSTKKTLERIVDRFSNKGAVTPVVYLTGNDSFRPSLCEYTVYKGNRFDAPRPYWYSEIRDYLIKRFYAEVVDGLEADDAMGISQCKLLQDNRNWDDRNEDQTCIVTLDKDLNMIPGWHYNWVKDELFFVEEMESLRYFYTQLLTGDTSDNIYGLDKVGPKKAEKLLGSCITEEDMFATVVQAYLDKGVNPRIYGEKIQEQRERQRELKEDKWSTGLGKDWRDKGAAYKTSLRENLPSGLHQESLFWFLENAALLWIRRVEDTHYEPLWHVLSEF